VINVLSPMGFYWSTSKLNSIQFPHANHWPWKDQWCPEVAWTACSHSEWR